MAKLNIELEDQPNGMVAIKWGTSPMEIKAKHESGQELTAAEGYLLSMAAFLAKKSEEEAAKVRADRLEVLTKDPHAHLLIDGQNPTVK